MKRNKLQPAISLEFLLNEVKEQKEEVSDILTVLQMMAVQFGLS